MPSLNEYSKLDIEFRDKIRERVLFRKNRFLNLTSGGRDQSPEILIVGDRPAPTAMFDSQMQFTPFGALWNSSLWLNLQLERAHIDEELLAWVNAADLDGKPTSYKILEQAWPVIISLGGNAKRWVEKSPHLMANTLNFPHPAYWKRFHGKEPYPLIEFLVCTDCVQPSSWSIF